MNILPLLFWIAFAIIAYAYVGYALLLALLTKIRTAKSIPGPAPCSISVIIAARNEEQNIARRSREFIAALTKLKIPAELLIVSDGSTDATASAVRLAAQDAEIPVRLLELNPNQGKAAAISHAAASAKFEILIFADARQTWAESTLENLLAPFADSTVGGVSGELILESAPGVMAGVGLYWRYEKWIRHTESRLYSMVGATGAISACRRKLFKPIPAGTILDDVYWPLNVVMQSHRVIHTREALAFDRLPENPRAEFRRKIRTQTGNYQLACRLPSAPLPWKNPILLQYISHKLLRLAVPWLMLFMLIASALIPGPLWFAIFIAQIAGYTIAILGSTKLGRRIPLALPAASFLVLNAATAVALIAFLLGQSKRTWTPTRYQPAPEHA